MVCEHPVTLQDPRRPELFDKFGTRLYTIQVPCGSCFACQQARRKLWFYRLKVESDKCVCSYCVTLTYDDLSVPDYEPYIGNDEAFLYHPIQYRDLQLFNKKLRKQIGSFRFFCIGEYGTKHLRPHFHVCYFFDRIVTRYDFDNAVFDSWFPHCRITIDTTNDRACNYILKYCLKPTGDKVPEQFRPIIRCSTKPYIGAGLLDDPRIVAEFKTRKSDVSHYLGFAQRLPRIYRDKLFTDDEKRFIQQEFGSKISCWSQKQKEDDEKYLASHPGTDVLTPPSVMRRMNFNQHIQKCAKLKSLK